MRWNSVRGGSRAGAPPAALVALAVSLLLLSAPSAEEKRISVYAPQVSFSLPVLERDGHEYVGLLEVLEPLGKVSARLEGKKWKLRFDGAEADFKEGKTGGKVRGNKVELPTPFQVESGRGLVPLRSLPSLLARFLETRVDFHESARRLFVGSAATRFTAEARKDAVVLNFSSPVNPVISTEPGKLKMTFTRDPVVSGSESLKVAGPLASAATFSESNGRAELTVLSSTPLLATFGDGGRSITLTAAPVQAAQAPPVAPPAPAPRAAPPTTGEATPGTAVVSVPAGVPTAGARPSYVVIVDASHGGDERGAVLSDKLVEKDVTLALARRVRNELHLRGVYALMARDSDSTVTLEQRAAMANSARAAIFVTLHAGALGNGVRVYTAMLPASDQKPGAFPSWETVQSGFVLASRLVAEEVVAEAARKDLPVMLLAAPVRPLNNIAAPAIAVEVAPPAGDVAGLNSAIYQQTVAAAVAAALVTARPKLEAAR